MSMFPILFGNSFDHDPWDYGRHQNQHSCPWDHFGLDINPAEIQLMSVIPSLLSTKNNELTGLKHENYKKFQRIVGKDGFQVHMNVQQFKPNEMNVKTVDDFVIIEGKHEDREDEHGHFSRHFVRKYKLPEGYDANQVISTLSSDGILTIKAPPPTKSTESKEIIVQIQQTGPAHLNIKENNENENNPNQKIELSKDK